jgi:hypothetical protein
MFDPAANAGFLGRGKTGRSGGDFGMADMLIERAEPSRRSGAVDGPSRPRVVQIGRGRVTSTRF